MLAGKPYATDAQRYPEWFGYITDSMLLRQQGASAAALYEMPKDSPSWRDAQRVLAMLWQSIELSDSRALQKIAASLTK